MQEVVVGDFSALKVWVMRMFGILGLLVSADEFVERIVEPSAAFPLLSQQGRLNVAIHLALLTAVCYGLLWSFAERVFSWKYGAGGGDSLPQGVSAVVLSTTVTIPLVLVPPIYQRSVGTQFLGSGHFIAGAGVILAGVLAHCLIYGTEAVRFPGLRHWIMESGPRTLLAKELLILLLHSILVHLCSVNGVI